MKKLFINALGLLVLLSVPLRASEKEEEIVLKSDDQSDESSKTSEVQDQPQVGQQPWWKKYYKHGLYAGAGALALGAAGYYGYQKYRQNQLTQQDNLRTQKKADYFALKEQERVLDSLKYPSNMTAEDFRKRGDSAGLHSTRYKDLRETEQWLKAHSDFDPSKTNKQFMDDRYKEQEARRQDELRGELERDYRYATGDPSRLYPSREVMQKQLPTRTMQLKKEPSEQDLKRQEQNELREIRKKMKQEGLTKRQKDGLKEQERKVKSAYFNKRWQIKENKKNQENREKNIAQRREEAGEKERQTYSYRKQRQQERRQTQTK